MQRKILNIIFVISLLVPFGACVDELEYNDYVIGEGNSVISGTVEFKPLEGTSLGDSRAPGNAIRTINKLTVVLYDRFDNYVGTYPLTEAENNLRIEQNFDRYDSEKDEHINVPIDVKNPDWSEAKTARATFNLSGIPYGRYKMYAVANMDVDEEIAKQGPDKLKSQTVEWKVEGLQSNGSVNSQMFGYFTEINSGEVNGNETSSGFEAPIITVNSAETHFHSWIKRLASKITIAFNPSGLHNGVNVYIHKVTIKDIPRYCYLGKINEPGRFTNQEIAKDSIIWETTDNNAQVLYYNNSGITNQNPGDGKDNHEKWLRLRKITPTYGDHSENGPALYFFENMQGNYPNDPKYDKKQQPDEVGHQVKPGDYDYKDNVPCGTYIEVEGYYDADVVESGYVSENPIIYRFMLGNDIYYNYNAERNHHYKLTMNFKGYGNQVDWHIVYEEEPPELFVPDQIYVPYLYNERSLLPIRAVGDLTDLTIKIVENNWAPYSETLRDGKYHVPEDYGTSASDVEERFLWNFEAYKKFNIKDDGSTNGSPELGFLALTAPDPLPVNVITNVKFSKDGNDKLKDYYNGEGGSADEPGTGANMYENYFKHEGGQHTRVYDVKTEGKKDKNINEYYVVKSPEDWAEKSTIVHIPLITRAKSMIAISGFTGNNPYDAFQRYAKIIVEATINGKKVTKDVHVFQVRRIVNPKAVWRKRDASAEDRFHVELMHLPKPGNGQKFSAFDSEGIWRAYIVDKSKKKHISLSKGAASSSMNDTIFGDAWTPIDFYIDFTSLKDNEPEECAIINIDYHGYTCIHKIFVRQGCDEPMSVVSGGAKWSPYNVYSAQAFFPDGSTTFNTNGKTSPTRLECTLAVNPLSSGSLFRRGNYGRGIYIKNNDRYGPLDPIGDDNLQTGAGNYRWSYISSNSDKDTNWEWAKFKAIVNGKTQYYRVPTYEDFNALASADYGFGVMYGHGANETLTQQYYLNGVPSAYGFQDDGDNTETSDSGVRGCIVYNSDNANQVFFPFGRYGMGRRVAWISIPNVSTSNKRGYLRYADVESPLTGAADIYRPIVYDLPAAPGAIYWINSWKADGHIEADTKGPCAAWDMNYFSLDFGPYTANCLSNGTSNANGTDALPLKLIYEKDE